MPGTAVFGRRPRRTRRPSNVTSTIFASCDRGGARRRRPARRRRVGLARRGRRGAAAAARTSGRLAKRSRKARALQRSPERACRHRGAARTQNFGARRPAGRDDRPAGSPRRRNQRIDGRSLSSMLRVVDAVARRALKRRGDVYSLMIKRVYGVYVVPTPLTAWAHETLTLETPPRGVKSSWRLRLPKHATRARWVPVGQVQCSAWSK